MEDLNAASLEDVKEWFRAYYGAANAVLVIAGDITAAEAKQKVEKYFGDIPSGPVLRRQEDWIAKMNGTHRAIMQDAVPQARIYKVWNIPGYRQRDFIMLDMAADVLGGGKNSRLYKRLVYTDRTATAVHGRRVALRNRIAGADHRHGETRRAIRRRGEGASTKKSRASSREGPTPAELERIRTTNYANFARGIERIDGFGGKSSILAESQVYAGSPDFYKTRLNWICQRQAADVQAVAQALDVGWRVRAQRRARGHVQDAGEHRGSQQGADARRRTVVEAAGAGTREAFEWTRDCRGRTPQRARWWISR